MTSIEWTDITWNPTAGCSILTSGCTNCYAMRMAARLDAMGVSKYKGLTRKSGKGYKWTGKIRLDYNTLMSAYKWSGNKMVFVNSMSDLFHDDLHEHDIRRVWKVMEENQAHTFQVLTKRAERMREITQTLPYLHNVWLGVSVESATTTNRIEDLVRSKAFVRFISFEPLLEDLGQPDLRGIDWCIVGGESGPGARPMRPEWVDGLYEATRSAGAAFHFKQWGGTQKKRTGRTLYGRIYDEFPMGRSAAQQDA